MRSPALILLLAALAQTPAAHAAAIDYALDRSASTVAFETDFGPDQDHRLVPAGSRPT